MSNYIVEDEIEDYEYPKENNSTNYTKLIVIGIGVLIVMIFIIIIGNAVKSGNYYTKLEQLMVERAKEYVINNNSYINNSEFYLDASKINVVMPSNCNILSGVLYSNGDYKPYLVCNEYESNLTSNQTINLLGRSVILLYKGQNYYEIGYSDGSNIQISGNVNIDAEGVYNIYYIGQDNNYAVRKVIVVDNQEAINYTPKLNISRDTVELNIGQVYDAKVAAIDVFDGDITNKIINVNNINTMETGDYQSIYYVSNSLGYSQMFLQDIFVFSNQETNFLAKLKNKNMTNSTVEIEVKITGDKYNYMVLPNGKTTTERELVYTVSDNGKYNFTIYNQDNSKITKSVEVNTIDKTTPSGTCSVIAYNDHLVFSVKMSTFNYIVGYNYHFGSKSSGFIQSSSYNSKEVANNNLRVTVIDYIGNIGSIPCQVSEQKSSLEPNGYQTMINESQRLPRLRVPIEQALAQRGHTINELNMCIYNRVKKAGPYTRYGVTAAAYGLVECTYQMTGLVLSYNHEGGKVSGENYCRINSDICGKLGVNRRWGNRGGACEASECWQGLNCATFVRWAMCNGGMNLCTRGEAGAFAMTSKEFFPEADGVVLFGRRVSYYSGTNLTNISPEQLVRMIKPGDVIAHYRPNDSDPGYHTYVVVGRNNEGIITADDGYFMKKITYAEMLRGVYSYRILFLDKYYANPNNRNNLYG